MSDHLKRLAAPRSWPLKRKINVWTTKQCPGAHSIEESVPATIMLRDIIKICDTAREVKKVVANRYCFVDGKPIKDVKTPIGLMDTLSIPIMGLYYRIVITDKGKIVAKAITKEEATWKLAMIDDKTVITGNKIQLNLHDGRNIVLDENQYKTGDVLKITIPDQKIEDVYELKAGATVLIFKGRHAGRTAVISEYIVTNESSDNIVKFTDGSETVKSNVFVIGHDESLIKLPEA